MPLTNKQQQAKNLINLLIRHCWSNPDFKTKLIKDPVKTIEEVTGVPNTLPEEVSIEVEDQSDSSLIYLNIPPKSHSISVKDKRQKPEK
ncbi:hypothetical protein [Zobellia sp. B3R18]|uniref:hypothetical protein n=1 Tax=Zobellia sp. B3R18 TaxID=2841568 RepID=UPI001C07D316|nr:hypothetical protein [Zobellia sp. B3R18]MBU2974980.1 hypothetical protein [Zobellia sp. B3R18]